MSELTRKIWVLPKQELRFILMLVYHKLKVNSSLIIIHTKASLASHFPAFKCPNILSVLSSDSLSQTPSSALTSVLLRLSHCSLPPHNMKWRCVRDFSLLRVFCHQQTYLQNTFYSPHRKNAEQVSSSPTLLRRSEPWTHKHKC